MNGLLRAWRSIWPHDCMQHDVQTTESSATGTQLRINVTSAIFSAPRTIASRPPITGRYGSSSGSSGSGSGGGGGGGGSGSSTAHSGLPSHRTVRAVTRHKKNLLLKKLNSGFNSAKGMVACHFCAHPPPLLLSSRLRHLITKLHPHCGDYCQTEQQQQSRAVF